MVWLGVTWGDCGPSQIFSYSPFKFSYADNFYRHQVQEVKLRRFFTHAGDTVSERVITMMQFWLRVMFSHELYKSNMVDITDSLISSNIRVLLLHSGVHA